MTTGGTESIILACKAYRDYGREVKGIKKPEMIVPVTAHSSFDKAAQYLNIKVRTVPVNSHSYTVSIKAMESAINKNTIMVGTCCFFFFSKFCFFFFSFLCNLKLTHYRSAL